MRWTNIRLLFLLLGGGVVFCAHAATPSAPVERPPLFLEEDGMWLTIPRTGTTLTDALTRAGIHVLVDDLLIPSSTTTLDAVDHVFLDHKKTLTVRVGAEKPITLHTFRSTVADALLEGHVSVSELDKVTPSLSTPLTNNLHIDITRVREATITEEETIDALTITRRDNTLLLGTTIVEDAGADGTRVQTFRVHSENGEETSRVLLKTTETKKPQPRHIRVGTKVVIVGSESGRASWYGAAGKTAAHRTLPFGTKLRIVRTDTGVSTIVEVQGRGPYIPGRVVDLSPSAFKDLAPLGTGIIPVRVEQLQS